jgi:hypothetical protein
VVLEKLDEEIEMKKLALTTTATLGVAVVGIAAALPAAHALDLNPTKVLEKIVPAITRARVNVHNNYPFPITVEMDNKREEHAIAPGGVATFTNANKGDNPTFRAHKEGAVINSKHVFLDGNKTVNFP